MKRLLSFKYTFDHLAALVAAGAAIGVVQTFVFGKHYLIPTMILVLAVLFGNLARYGYRDRAWAKVVLYWIGVILNFHVLFALFWSVKYRSILGDAFEYVFAPLTVSIAVLLWQYAKQNELFRRPG
ncbi:MAG: hypothetical protein L0Y45_00515 [Woeseiaceae bacterium]|nr:hypothetical protein [Woeseiaceae bacterium]